MDFLKGFGNVMSNPLIQQYLAGIGGGLATGGFKGGVAAGSEITGQNITNQNYAKMIQRVLAGDMSDGAKMTMDKDGMKLSLPTPPKEQPVQMDSPMPKQPAGILSPFGSGQPNFSASELAGLNPELITQALQLKMNQDQILQRSIESIRDEVHKQALDRYYDAQIKNMEVDNARAEREYLDSLNKVDKTELMKNYEYAKDEGFEGSIIDFKNSGGTPNSYEEYQLAKKEGYEGNYVDFIKTKAKAGATNITLSPYEQTIQRGEAQAEIDVRGPDFATKVANELSKVEGWDLPPGAESFTDRNIPNLQKKLVVNEMGRRIRIVYGDSNVKPVAGGWKVKTPKGEIFIRGPQ